MKNILRYLISNKLSIVAVCFLIATTLLLGVMGVKVILISLFLMLPVFIILMDFDLSHGEKIIFSIFLGLGFVSTVIYYPGIFMSLKWCYIFLLLIIGLCVITYRFKRGDWL